MRSFAVLLTNALLAAAINAAGLNDTGQTSCYNTANEAVVCSTVVGGDTGVNPRQDARYGRDAQAAAATLTKIGAGAAGFDFTKIANNGTTLAATAVIGTDATDWACTKDNVTGLIWEIKTAGGLRDRVHTYLWYSTQGATNGANAGALGTDTCGGSLSPSPYNNQCNTQNLVAAVNATTLCGASDWRLPTQKELLSIIHAGASYPSVDAAYFPNSTPTFAINHWTASTYADDPTYAWTVNFFNGSSVPALKANGNNVRLVRAGM
jgi:hypothetical protein